jgi:hypothetical protein
MGKMPAMIVCAFLTCLTAQIGAATFSTRAIFFSNVDLCTPFPE